MEGMKLFLWTDVLWDHSSGLAFVLAHDEAEARSLLKEKMGWWAGDLDEEFYKPPTVIDYPYAHYKYGGQ